MYSLSSRLTCSDDVTTMGFRYVITCLSGSANYVKRKVAHVMAAWTGVYVPAAS